MAFLSNRNDGNSLWEPIGLQTESVSKWMLHLIDILFENQTIEKVLLEAFDRFPSISAKVTRIHSR